MEGSVLSFLKVEWKVSNTGSAHWASSYSSNTLKHSEYRHATPLVHIILNLSQTVFVLTSLCCTLCRETATTNFFSSPGQRPCELLPSRVRRPSVVNFHILIFSETTGPIATKLWWNGPWIAPFQNCVRWSWLPTKMATKLKIEKRGDEILIVHCCFSICQNELKF